MLWEQLCSPQKKIRWSLNLMPRNVILFGNRFCTANQVKMKSYRIKAHPSSISSILIKRERPGDWQGRRRGEDRKGLVMLPQTRNSGLPTSSRARQSKERFFFGASGSRASPTPWFQTSNFQHSEHVLLSKPSRWWYLVPAALGNYHK